MVTLLINKIKVFHETLKLIFYKALVNLNIVIDHQNSNKLLSNFNSEVKKC